MMIKNYFPKTFFALLLTVYGASLAQAQTVTIALSGDINNFDPAQTASIGTDLSVLSNVYPALILRAPDRRLTPSLATKWVALDDNTWDFTLVSNAHFINGEPIDAQTVAWNINRILNKKKVTVAASWYSRIQEVIILSPTHLQIKTSSPFPALPDQLSMLFLLPPKWTQTHDPSHEVSSGGPYIIDEIVPGDHVSMHANPDYFGPQASFKKAVYRIIPEITTALYALETGAVDYVSKIPTAQLKQISRQPDLIAGSTPSIWSVFIKINTEIPPFNNEIVRKALNYAVDKKSIVATIFNNQTTTSTCQVLTPAYFGYNKDLTAYKYDPETARKLIKQSGINLNQVYEFDIPRGSYLQGDDAALAVQQMFQAVGIKTKLRLIDFGNYIAKYRKTHKLAPLSLLGQAWPTLDADGFLSLFQTGNPYSYWNNPLFDAALQTGDSTTNHDLRQNAYMQATQIMCEQAPVVFMYTEPATYAHAKRVLMTPRGDGWLRAFDMHLRPNSL